MLVLCPIVDNNYFVEIGFKHFAKFFVGRVRQIDIPVFFAFEAKEEAMG